MSTASSLDVDCLQQAAEWYATLRADDATDEDRRQWQSWLTRDPAHAEAWQRIESVSRRFAPLHGAGAPKAVLAGAKVARQIALGRRRVFRSIAGLFSAGLAGWLGWRFTPLPRIVASLQADYRTGTGEQREIRLADGTRLWLNTGSAVDVGYQATARIVTLRAGEIFVETAKDEAHRPFYVETSFGRVEALGTRFSLRQEDARVQVDVFEGVVEIRNDAGIVQRVAAGRRTCFDALTIAAADAADPAREAWTRGIVIANNITLRQLVEELSRYWNGHIAVSPEVANLKIIGVYPATDTNLALTMMESELPLRVQRTLPWWVTVRPR